MDSTVHHTRKFPRYAWLIVPGLIPLVLALAFGVGEGVRAISSLGPAEIALVVDPDGLPLSGSSRDDEVSESWSKATALESEEAFLAGKISLASSKDASLWIDLVDSTATLAIEGVPVRICRISTIDLSAMLLRMSVLPSWTDSLRAPFMLTSAAANIPHIPIRVVEAPKDTAEARLRPPDAFAPEERHVTADLRFDRRLVVHLVSDDQERTGVESAWRALRTRTMDAAERITRLFSGQEEPLDAEISIRMSSSDVRAVYRGLRQGAGMVVRFRDS